MADSWRRRRTCGRLEVVDLVLERVDLRVDGIEQVEEGVRDLVDEAVDEVPGRRLAVVRGVERGRVEGLAARWRLAHGDEDRRRRDEVDLPRLLAAVLPQRDRRRRRRTRTRRGSRAAAAAPRPHRVRRERLDDLRVDGDGKSVEKLLTGRVDEVYPACAHPRRG